MSDTLQLPNLAKARSLAFAAAASQFLLGAFVTSESINSRAMLATSSTVWLKTASFAFEGFVNPLSFLTNCSDDAWISSFVAGGSKLNSVLIFRHIRISVDCQRPARPRTTGELFLQSSLTHKRDWSMALICIRVCRYYRQFAEQQAAHTALAPFYH